MRTMAEHSEPNDGTDTENTLSLRNAVESMVDDVFVRTRSSLEYFGDHGVTEDDAWEMAAYYQEEGEAIEERILEEYDEDGVVREAVRTLDGVHGVDTRIRGKVARFLSDVREPYTREDVENAFRHGGVPREEMFLYEEVCDMCGIEE